MFSCSLYFPPPSPHYKRMIIFIFPQRLTTLRQRQRRDHPNWNWASSLLFVVIVKIVYNCVNCVNRTVVPDGHYQGSGDDDDELANFDSDRVACFVVAADWLGAQYFFIFISFAATAATGNNHRFALQWFAGARLSAARLPPPLPPPQSQQQQ